MHPLTCSTNLIKQHVMLVFCFNVLLVMDVDLSHLTLKVQSNCLLLKSGAIWLDVITMPKDSLAPETTAVHTELLTSQSSSFVCFTTLYTICLYFMLNFHSSKLTKTLPIWWGSFSWLLHFTCWILLCWLLSFFIVVLFFYSVLNK